VEIASEPGAALPARCSAGLLSRARLCAVFTRAMCEKACGKLPTRRLTETSYSSESSPTSLRRSRTTKQTFTLFLAAEHYHRIGKPERAGQKRSFPMHEARFDFGGIVAHNEPVLKEPPFDRPYRSFHTGIFYRRKPRSGNQEETAVEEFRAI
jgi:hypothetical protein